ncbi:MAG TPA: hypothetical protein VGO67_08895 [Verrucomicrobiae bacterium]|jgi:hypothetical protein
MKAVNLVDVLHRKRFKPFELKLDSGESISVKHPDCVLFSEDKTVAVVAEGEHFHIVDLEHISNLMFRQK